MWKNRTFKMGSLMVGLLCAVFCLVGTIVSVKTYEAFSDGPEEYVELPIIMYHSILDSTAKAGEYIITPAVLEEDFKYLVENGYTAISIDELIDYANGTGTLPEKPVMITFDDGHYNNYSYALPLLRKYGLKAVISVVGTYTDMYSQLDETPNNNYSCLTWEQIEELLQTGIIDIGNHSDNLHDPKVRLGAMKVSGETDEQFARVVYEDLSAMQEKLKQNTGYTSKVLAYPFGKYSEVTEEVARELGFSVTLTCAERKNVVVKGEADTIYGLGRYNRPYGISTYEFMRQFA